MGARIALKKHATDRAARTAGRAGPPAWGGYHVNRGERRAEAGRTGDCRRQRGKGLAHAVRVARLCLMVIGMVAIPWWPVAAGPSELALPGFPDMTGRSGESPAVFLNPAAAAGLPNPKAGLWATVPGPDPTASSPSYALTLLDPGGRLAGGLVAILTDDPTGQSLSLSYSAAARLGPAALGLRPVWTRQADVEGTWTLDLGFAWQVAPWMSVGIAAHHLPLGGSHVEIFPPWGLAGLTLTATGLNDAQLSLGVSAPDLTSDASLAARAGLRLPLGSSFRLLAGYEHDLRSGEPVGWSGSLALRAGQLFIDLGYQSDQVYNLGIEAGW